MAEEDDKKNEKSNETKPAAEDRTVTTQHAVKVKELLRKEGRSVDSTAASPASTGRNGRDVAWRNDEKPPSSDLCGQRPV